MRPTLQFGQVRSFLPNPRVWPHPWERADEELSLQPWEAIARMVTLRSPLFHTEFEKTVNFVINNGAQGSDSDELNAILEKAINIGDCGFLVSHQDWIQKHHAWKNAFAHHDEPAMFIVVRNKDISGSPHVKLYLLKDEQIEAFAAIIRRADEPFRLRPGIDIMI
jgi:hypothetical protein